MIQDTAFYGYLYNRDFHNYVSVDNGNKWLYADTTITSEAVMWTANLDSLGNFVLTATAGITLTYFNWRNITGAYKFYDVYDQMRIDRSAARAHEFQFKSIRYDHRHMADQ